MAILIDDRGRALSGRGFTFLPQREQREMYGIVTIDYRYQQAGRALGDKRGRSGDGCKY